jgi:hypothetical protein
MFAYTFRTGLALGFVAGFVVCAALKYLAPGPWGL